MSGGERKKGRERERKREREKEKRANQLIQNDSKQKNSDLK